ncbi:hypothetical protein C0Q70_02868 [Pomacea canaliculata]|uniref:Fibrillin-2 n=1 Tax=Pomacea canaliculata TaxID=400727 RepID=A0A2T7PR51_POMCA|nr:hypothetical protein C0Q70_02868 [Pomacea canaliculata]
MWFDGLNRPIPVTCIFYPFPPRGEIVMQPPDFLTETVANQATNRNVTYYAVSITYMREVINSANYCNQPVYVFRTSTVPQDADPYGFFSQQQRIQQGVSTRELSADEIATACQEPPFAALCAKYGAPTGLVVTNKDVIPITRMYLKARTDSIVIAIANATCSYVEKDCEAIRKSGQSTPVDNSNYMIDPGQADAIQPFVASCEFTRDQGITKININDTFWQGTGINNDGTNGPFNFQFKNVYANATPAQVNSLSLRQVRMFSSSIGNNNINPEGLLTLYSGNTSNFGTPYSPGAVGCACGALDTCATPDLTCNCDARGPLTSDQGFITDSSVLPVVGFYRNIRSPSGRGRLSLTSVRCGPMWAYDMPKDCIEAYSLGFRYGINYTVSGEYLINPDNTTSSPFLVYCDYSDPTNPVTIVRPRRPRERVPVKNTTRVDYNGGPTDGQLAALLRISVYCYQPVRVALPQKQVALRFAGLSDIPQSYWSTGSGGENTCTCGTLQRCGGTRSYSQQRATKCNCDIGDDEDRSDAAILSIKAALPFRRFIADAFADGSLNLTVGNLYCASKPIGGKTAGSVGMTSYLWHYVQNSTSVNWASTTALHKRSVSTWPSGYECVCPDGWKGLGRAADDTEAPAANGRQCIDDNECLPGNNPCPPHNSLCANIPGSFICNCTEGYRNVDRLTCEDIDECAEKTHDCDVNAKCANTDGSFRCSCRTGFRGSGKRDDCSPVGQCTCFGDPHCLSFDKAWFHPQGGCENALVQNDCRLRGSATNPCPRFRVSTHHWNRGIEVPGVYAWIKEVKIVFGDNRIVLGQGGTIIVDGKLRSNMWSILSDDRTETIASVTRIGLSKVSMWTSCGLEVTWNGRDAVEILVPTSMMNKTCGMCGNYNGDKSDDWIVGPECPTLEGQQITTPHFTTPTTTTTTTTTTCNEGGPTNRQTLFSNSWTVNASQECTPDCNPSEPEPTCVSQYKSDYMCKKLFSETSPFANCLAQMPSDIREGLLFSCQFDLCHTNDTESTVCEVAETIANFCEEQMAGDPIVWRSPHLCGEPDCGVNEEFLICGPSEESTCNAPVSTYYQLCREGCFCVKGFRRQGDECLPESRCGCPYGEDLMKIGSQQVLNNCSLLVTCVGHEDHTEEPYSCSDIEECAIDDGIEACVCKEGTGTNSETGECIPGDHCAGNTECPATSECVTTRTSFYCNCSEGYINVDRTTCKDVNECTEGTSNCAENAECTNLDGGYTCNCATGYSGDGRTECKDNDECTEGTNDCDDNAECTNTDGGYNCTCKDGYSGDGMAGNCRDEDECSEGTSDCDANAKCTNTGGGYTCTCNEGYSGDGKTGNCQDDDECTDGTNDCDVNAECTNEEGGYTCACKDGYLGDGTAGSCKEDDDCLPGNNDCSENAVCVNTRESYECNCTEGYRNKDARTCEDIDECEEGSNNCDENAVCTNVPGSYECACVGDYIGDGSAGSCTKDNDCAPESNPCPINAKCVNTRDGFYCNCSEGYRNVDSVSCEDSDECAEGTNDCDVNAECTNEPGTFRCTCFGGYVGDGKAGNCKKDDDCKEGNNSCPKNSVCVNTPDGFSCNCTEGYHNVDAVTCEDEDECAEGSHDCDVNAECTNLDGSYQCACNEGYTGDGTFGTCIKPDLCKDISCTAVNTECRNGVCVCKEGYELDCEECKDIDECANSPDTCGHIGQVCINTPGSYRCECVDGFYADGGYCHDINECEDGSAVCGQHSECVNMLGAYDCVCCMGYSKHGASCRRDYNLDIIYGAPGLECCNYPGGNSDDPIPVCASDGRSHANYAAMVVDGCRRNKTVEVSYKGYCKTTCSEVECDRPFQKCVETEIGAQCACPVCDVDATKPLTPVCGSNGRIYQNECFYQLTMCSMGQRNVQLRPLTYCNETHPGTRQSSPFLSSKHWYAQRESPLGPWSAWSECSPKCGKGHTTRSRTASGPTAKQLTQRAVCYTPCENGPCEEDSCPNPGQVCEVGDNNEAVCTCPDCTGQSEEPVCALLGELVRTFENECQLRRSACELTKPYRVLEARACEDTPPTCTKTNYIPELVEGDCVATLPEDLGFCYGKCGQNPAWCCRPEGTENVKP